MNENGTLAHTFNSFTRQLSEIETRCAGTNTIETSIFDELLGATHDLFQTCYDYERRASAEEIAQAQEQFREITTPWFSKSYFMQRARVWPRGYPGDFETLEAVYHGVPRSEDHFGRLLDVYFLTRQLALALGSMPFQNSATGPGRSYFIPWSVDQNHSPVKESMAVPIICTW